MNDKEKIDLIEKGGSLLHLTEDLSKLNDLLDEAYSLGQSHMKQRAVEKIRDSKIKYPPLDDYLLLVKSGNKDEMYDRGYEMSSSDLLEEINNL